MKKQVGPDFFEKNINFSSMKLNGSESAFAFVSAKANVAEDRYDHELMLYDIEKSEVRPLLKLEKKPIFEWMDDDRILILGAFEEADK